MRRAAALIAALTTAATAAHAQRPTVSSVLRQYQTRDTTLTVWFFGSRDLPLEQVAAAVTAIGGQVRRKSRWLHAVSATIHAPAIGAAQRSTTFRHLQPVARFRGSPEPTRTVPAPPTRAAGQAADSLYGPSAMPFRLLNLFPLVHKGLRGTGVTIGVLDSGFETELAAFASASVIAQYDFVFDDSIVRNQPSDTPGAADHGTSVWSLLAADVPGSIIGVAPDARYILAKTEDVRSETRVEEDNWVAALEWADSIGVDVVISSVGYLAFDGGFSYQPEDLNGDVAVTTVAADSAAARGIVVVTAVGNDGDRGFGSLITPADGDSVIAVGAEDSLGLIPLFSSRGPTADGRIKPDLVAPGLDVFVVDPSAITGFARVDGTSFSTPLIAGTAALIRELHPTLSPVDVRDAMRRTGSQSEAPDSLGGWGRPDGAAAAYFPFGVTVLEPSDSILTSVTPTISFDVAQIAAVALPVDYHVRAASDSTFTTMYLDTVVSSASVALPQPLRPDEQVVVEVTVSTTDSVSFVAPLAGPFIAPAWVTLTSLSDSAGLTIRELRPTFTWLSPDVTAPPGPFTYDFVIERADNSMVELEARGLTALEYTPPRDLERNTPYRWRVTALLGSDTATVDSDGTFLITDDSTPAVTILFQNFPNPFPNAATGLRATCIWFDLSKPGDVRLDILDIRGLIVRSIVPGQDFASTLPAGRYGRPPDGGSGTCDPRLSWDGSADDGSFVPRGIYLIRFHTEDETFFKRIVFMGQGF